MSVSLMSFLLLLPALDQNGVRSFSHFACTSGVRMNAVGEEFRFVGEGGVHVDDSEFHFLGQFIEALDFLQHIFFIDAKIARTGNGAGATDENFRF